MKKEFILPDIWFITLTNENYDIVNNWFESLTNSKSSAYRTGICGYYKNSQDKIYAGTTGGKSKESYFDFGDEISFEQFKQYVLKEEPIIEPLKDYTYLIKILEKL